MKPATDLYTDGAYALKNPDWHAGDSAGKAADIIALFEPIFRAGQDRLRIAEVGAGFGGVLSEVCRLLHLRHPSTTIEAAAFEISEHACREAARRHPEIDVRQKAFVAADGPFDVVMLIDVLEHLENPSQLLREVRGAGRWLVVRQPLLESISTFRRNDYPGQRAAFGHIAWFNHRSFNDLLAASGWRAVETRLTPPWQLAAQPRRRVSWLNRLFAQLQPEWASYLFAGYYLFGVFDHE